MKKLSRLIVVVGFLSVILNAHAAKTHDCSKKSLQSQLDKLNKTVVNVIEFEGLCDEDILIEGFDDLTLKGISGAEISGSQSVFINDSTVRLESMTLSGIDQGAYCTGRSECYFQDVSVICSGGNGISVQDQSSVEIRGTGTISGCGYGGVAVYGASVVNMGATDTGSFDPEAPGPVLTNSIVGAWVQDGSFFRSDNVSFTMNSVGVWGQRNATIKIFDNRTSPVGIDGSAWAGVYFNSSSTAQIGLPITNTTGPAIELGPLSWVQPVGAFSMTGNAPDGVVCGHPTAVPGGGLVCEP